MRDCDWASQRVASEFLRNELEGSSGRCLNKPVHNHVAYESGILALAPSAPIALPEMSTSNTCRGLSHAGTTDFGRLWPHRAGTNYGNRWSATNSSYRFCLRCISAKTCCAPGKDMFFRARKRTSLMTYSVCAVEAASTTHGRFCIISRCWCLQHSSFAKLGTPAKGHEEILGVPVTRDYIG